MKGIKKGLAILLVLCTLLSLVFVAGAGMADDTAQDITTAQSDAASLDHRIVHLDCGRKYFSVDSVKTLIDAMAKNGYNELELAFGNAGLRFLLNDMSVEVTDTVCYKDDEVRDAVVEGNKTQNSSNDGRCWDENDMSAILAYADSKGIEIVPLLNMPGHMNALLNVNLNYKLTNEHPQNGTITSAETIDLNKTDAYAFGLAVLQKYVAFFTGKVSYFNFGADEYGNDIYNPYFSMTGADVSYERFVEYFNKCAVIIKNAGMTPRAFNDFVYYNNQPGADKGVEICYWNNQWSGSPYVKASSLANQGYTLINTNSNWYYALGEGYTLSAAVASAQSVKYNQFRDVESSETISNPAGAMVCIWCDDPNAASDTETISGATQLISAFAESNAGVFPEIPLEKTVNLTVGETATYTQSGQQSVTLQGDASIATADVTASQGGVAYNAQATASIEAYLSNNYPTSNVLDGNVSTYYWSSGAQSVGTYVQVDLGAAITMNAVQVSSPKDGDVCTKADVQISSDGTTWTTVGQHTGTSKQTVTDTYTFDSQKVRYIRVVITAAINNWWKLSDISFGTVDGSGKFTRMQPSGTASEDATNITFTGMSVGKTTYQIGNTTYQVIVSKAEKTVYLPVDGSLNYSDTSAKAYDMTGDENAVEVSATESGITFTGKSVGKAVVTTTNCVYNIEVVNEDPSVGGTKNIEYLITGLAVTGSDNQTSKSISSADVYGAEGKAISELVPAAGTYHDGTYTVKYWKTQYLTGTDRLPSDRGWTNNSKKGITITHIRYFGGKWEVKDTEGNWISVDTDSDLAAYYLHQTEVTQEVTTYVTDWGDDWSVASQLHNTYGLYDFAVVYPSSSDRDPSKFANDNTMLFNAEGQRDYAVSDTNGTGRYVHDVQVKASDEYEVYMITAIRVQCDRIQNNNIPNYTDKYSSEYYTADEKIIWVDDESSIPEGTAMTKYGEYYHVGGDPTIPVMKLYTKQAILFTYYLRVKPNDDSLKVHYIDQATNTEFYGYPIAVKNGTVFDEKIDLNKNWKGDLAYGTVTNNLNKKQTVSADLSTMPAIGAQYRYSAYTCVTVEHSDDCKEVYLYYTFNNAHSFVVDFGLPVTITNDDLKISGDWASATVTGAQYGTATATVNGDVTYTPTQTLKSVETLQLTLTGEKSITHQIYIYPATTVYYEEGFATYSGAVQGGTDKGNGTQTASVAGSKAYYGYDAAYLNNTQDSNGTVATLNAGGEGTFTFTGTGVDVYACTKEDSGKVMIYVYRGSGDNMTLKRLIAVDTRQLGEQSAEDTAYNVPIVSLSGLDYGEYTLVMKEVQTKTDTGKVNYPVYIDGFRVHGTLDVVNTQVYKDDNEANPTFVELRDSVLQVNLNLSEYNGQYAGQIAENVMSQVYAKDNDVKALVINASQTGVDSTNVQDLLENGPKNEIYLKQNESLVFTANATSAQIGLKALNGATTYTINNDTRVSLNTSTDMFYPVNTGMVTITNTGSGILSITELKLFGAGTSTASVEPMSAPALTRALMSLGFEPEPVEATATLNITVQCGDKAVPVTLTADGMSGDTHTFTAAEIKAAVEQALPEGYNVDDVTFSDVTVACGESADVSFTAAQPQTPDTPTSTIGKIIAVAKRVINRIIGWFR